MGSNFWWILLVAAALIVLFTFRDKFKPQRGVADELEDRFRNLTPETIESLCNDDQLVTAVIANLNAKLDRKHPDPYHELAVLSRGRYLVYAVWLFSNEALQNGLAACFDGPCARFVGKALEGFDLFGATHCAEVVRAAQTAEDPNDWNGRFMTARTDDAVTLLLADYIRENTEEFID